MLSLIFRFTGKYKKETIKHLEINFFNENKYIKNKSFIETAYNIVEKSSRL